MPEAAVDKDDLPASEKHKIRLARKISVHSVSVAHGMKLSPDRHLGFHSLRSDVGHDLGSALTAYRVHHASQSAFGPLASSRQSLAGPPTSGHDVTRPDPALS